MGCENSYIAGDLTMMALEALHAFNDSNVAERNLYLGCPDNYIKFSDGVKKMVGSRCGSTSEKELLSYIEQSAGQNGVDLPMPTIKNWLMDKSNPQANAASRDNVYKLCFALNFTVEETVEFFSKVYLERPFDSRNVEEAVYLFCMNNHYSYDKVKELTQLIVEKVLRRQSDDDQPLITKTRVLSGELLQITTERDFQSFIETNRGSFQVRNSTILNCYRELLKDAKEMAQVTSNDALLDIIYDCKLEEVRKKSNATIKKNSKFLDVVKSNFPQKEQFHQIEKNKAQYDTIRKALILLKFYSFFMHVGENNTEEDFEDFCIETNDMLYECNYPLLYSRNPYDWMFMHCAACSHDRNINIDIFQPLDELRDIMVDMFEYD